MSDKILGIRSPLSSDVIYIEIDDETASEDTIQIILNKTIAGLEEIGDFDSAMQLSQLLQNHSPFTLKGEKLDIHGQIKQIDFHSKLIETEIVEYAEITLLKQHQGGLK